MYGVPTEQFVNEFSDIEFEYTWFNNIHDAIAFVDTIDNPPWDPIEMMITMGVPT